MVSAEGFANLNPEALARLTRSSLRTVRRWRASGLIPQWAFDLLTLLLYRPLGMLAEEWDGWHLRTSVIEAPNGYQFTPGELMSIPLRLQQIRALELELARVREQQHQGTGRQPVIQIIAPRRDGDLFDHGSALPLPKPAVLPPGWQSFTLGHGSPSSLPVPLPSLRVAFLPASRSAPPPPG